MHDYITVIDNYPSITGKALLFTFFLMFVANVFDGGLGESIDHAVTGAGTDDEIVSKRDDVFQVYQDNIFTFFFFK